MNLDIPSLTSDTIQMGNYAFRRVKALHTWSKIDG